ncbi:MAG: bis(5'-nucleosyl)-tetraphosphatase [Thermoproteus sp.]|jgi:8-oxo-dGTP pyrophosphatase MutT (NUDIX family)|nr:bis(5'-nucleosyl)-tetraphosphatase [Thermoproteus sp.]
MEISAGAVVFYDGGGEVEYLLLLYPGGHWDFPKGNIEAGETPERTALREIKEETGLDVELVPGFKEEIEYFYYRERRRIKKRVIYFLARARSKDVKLSWEHKGYVWLPFGQALARITFENSRGVLAKAHRFLRGAPR